MHFLPSGGIGRVKVNRTALVVNPTVGHTIVIILGVSWALLPSAGASISPSRVVHLLIISGGIWIGDA